MLADFLLTLALEVNREAPIFCSLSATCGIQKMAAEQRHYFGLCVHSGNSALVPINEDHKHSTRTADCTEICRRTDRTHQSYLRIQHRPSRNAA